MSRQIKQLNRQEKREQIRNRLLIAPELSNRNIAKSLGVSHHTVGEVREKMIESGQIAHAETQRTDWIKHPYIIENPAIFETLDERGLRALKAPGILDLMLERGLNSPIYAQRVLYKKEKAERKRTTFKIGENDCRLFQADITEDKLPMIADNSVDAIITDPLYERSAIPLYGYLSQVANRVLKDNGSLVVMCGNSYLPEFLQELTKHMKYWWTLAYMTQSGGSTYLQWKRTYTFWKPVIWLTKNTYTGEMIYDVVTPPPPDKNREKLHPYEQSEKGFELLVERFTNPCDTILDPFMGSGTTGVASVKLGRKFIGIDIDAECVEIATQRIKQELDK